MNDLRLVKFQTLIEDISETFMSIVWGPIIFEQHPNLALRLIFDYDECNEYARIIIDKSSLLIFCDSGVWHDSGLWHDDVRSLDQWDIFVSLSDNKCDTKTRISASKLFVELCRKNDNSQACYKFIFWALLVLTVDKNNAQEYLSLICDFAKMLKITNDEFEDIVHVIKCVYNTEDKNYAFKTETIPKKFGGVLNLYSD